MRPLPFIDLRTRREWRAWLQANHASSAGIWVVTHKSHTGVAAIPNEDLACEALCFGWIDSLVKRLDDRRYARKVTPRRPTSRWSAINRRRWTALKNTGLLAEAGRAAAPPRKTRGYTKPPRVSEPPPYFVRALKRNAKAWRCFQTLAPTYRRHYVMWIHLAKRPETRERRIREAVRLLAAGRKLGLK